ncbi:glycosyltransferase [Pseudomonas saudiphocaensis]|uniref:glycosyltransferase n=1 Tax=Pseudomonas saudiphocaensis TaxID=1499686 RepID=UPI000F770E6D|nr:glycosyltransferase [Pseudomonas saudiphocaensis]RRV17501.1 glycosyltransferase [Pseudomonas saudiphocaensis]
MTHFAIIAPPFHSHMRAFEAIALLLVYRGHRVTFVQQADVRTMLSLPQAEFAAIGAGSHPAGSLAAVVRRAAQPGNPIGLRRVIADMAASTDMICREAPALLRSLGVDALLVDQMEPGGALVAEHLGLPFISVACALPFNREPLVPLPVMPWRYRATPWGEKLNLNAGRVYDYLMRPHGNVIRQYCQAFGLPPRHGLSDCLSPLLQISQTVASFDFPRQALPAHFHAVGPLRLPMNEAASPVLATLEKPFVYASLGTLQGHRYRLFRQIAQACSVLSVPLLITHCGGLGAEQVKRLAGEGEVWVSDFVPQRAALAEAAAVVTHAGLNTVLDALEAGAPMLALPIAFDQPGVAARIEHSGVGLRLNHRLASPARIAAALDGLLSETRFRERSMQLGEEVRSSGGAVRAVELIEAALGVKKKSEVRRAG